MCVIQSIILNTDLVSSFGDTTLSSNVIHNTQRRNNLSPITTFTGHKSQNPVSTFLRETDGAVVTLTEAQRERSLNLTYLQLLFQEMHPLMNKDFTTKPTQRRKSTSKGRLAMRDIMFWLHGMISLRIKNWNCVGGALDGY